MANEVTSNVEFAVMNDDAKSELIRLFEQPPVSDENYRWLDYVINRILGINDTAEIDRSELLGSKWCYIDELNIEDWRVHFRLVSAWRPPFQALEFISTHLGKSDPNLIMTLQYDDEGIPPRFFGWATYLSEGLDESEEIDDEGFYEAACEIDETSARMEEHSDEFSSYFSENYAEIYHGYTSKKIRFEVNWQKENNYGREEDEDE